MRASDDGLDSGEYGEHSAKPAEFHSVIRAGETVKQGKFGIKGDDAKRDASS